MILCLCSLCDKEFSKQRARGYMDVCRTCHRARRVKNWKLANPERKAVLNQQWAETNRDKDRASKVKWSKENKEQEIAKAAKYRAKKKNAIPLWADLEQIKIIYLNCPQGYEVDHIIPLQGKDVSGLHIENNLQYLTSIQNKMKSNKLEGNP